jgi:hypothetical protein
MDDNQTPENPNMEPPILDTPPVQDAPATTGPDDRILDSNTRQEFPEDFNRPQPTWTDWFAANKLWVLGGFMLMILLMVGMLWFLRNQNSGGPQTADVMLSINGPADLASGNEAEYEITYTNAENSDLTNVTLEVFYPANFKFVSAEPKASSANGQRFNLPLLRQGESGEVKVRGKISGGTGELKEIRAKLNFGLSNFSSTFNVETKFTTTLKAPELEMEITGPIDVTNGQTNTFTINYKNVSGREFENTAVELAYPEGFKFSSSLPAPTKNQNYWGLGRMAVGATGKIEVTGNFVGDPGSEMQVTGDLGQVLNGGLAPQIHASASFKIQASSLTLTQEANPSEIVLPGEAVNYTLQYANYGSTGQSNVVIAVTLDGAMLDLGKLRVNDGIVTGNIVTWKSATVSNLSLISPNQKGQLTFSVPLKQTIPTNLKNQVIKTSTLIYSDQVPSPIRGQDLELKVGTKMEMIVSGRYVSGAMPMQVGQPTTFEVNILLTNLSNDVTDAAFVAAMPLPASAWANAVTPDTEKSLVTFAENPSRVRWKIGNLAAFVGKYSAARSMNFRLDVTPNESDRGTEMTLLRNIQVTGTDSFTGKEVKTTELFQLQVSDLGDDVINSKGSSVQ